MAYIGKSPSIGAYSMLDNLTASATASYSLTLDSVAFVPESANHLIVSLNGVIQKAGSSFTVSGSTLTFSSALTSSDSINFVLALGNVLDIGTPSDSTVTNAKTNFVSTSSAAGLQIKGDGTTDGTLQLNCSQNSHGIKLASPAHSAGQSYKLIFPAGNVTAGKVLKVDSVSGSGTTGIGTLTFGDAGGSNTPNFKVDLSANISVANSTNVKITWDVEQWDTASAFASNKFTVPSGQGGKYFFHAQYLMADLGGSDKQMQIKLFKNGTEISYAYNRGERDRTCEINTVLNLSAKVYIEVYERQNGGSKVNLLTYAAVTHFLVVKLIE